MSKIEPVERIYDGISNYIGENRVYKCGDVLYVSTKNNDEYDIILVADGISRFIDLYREYEESENYVYIAAKK